MSGASASTTASTTASNITSIGSGVSTMIGMIGQYGAAKGLAQSARLSAQIEQNNWNMQADAAEFNARMADLSAHYARDAGRFDIARLGQQYGQMRGKQRTALAANGADLSVGSAAEVQASSDVLQQIDVHTLENNAIKKAWGYEVQATNYRNQAAMARITAGSIRPEAAYQTTLMNGVTGIAAKLPSTIFALGSLDWGGKGKDEQAPAPLEERDLSYLKKTTNYISAYDYEPKARLNLMKNYVW